MIVDNNEDNVNNAYHLKRMSDFVIFANTQKKKRNCEMNYIYLSFSMDMDFFDVQVFYDWISIAWSDIDSNKSGNRGTFFIDRFF